MNCPLQSEETLDLLLDYSAGRLDRTRAGLLELHMAGCKGCAAYRVEQAALWDALDAWQPEPVSIGFNRTLWQKIDAAAAAPWHRRLADALRFGAWKPAFPLAAAALVIAAGFVFDHQTNRVAPVPSNSAVASGVSVSDAEQVEKTLDDIQLLRQFDAAAASSGSTNAM